MSKEITAEEFLREKLESEIGAFGDGTREFHTRDVEHLLKCLEIKDRAILQKEEEKDLLIAKVNFDVEKQFKELLTLVMTKNNASAEERLGYIRNKYKELYTKINP